MYLKSPIVLTSFLLRPTATNAGNYTFDPDNYDGTDYAPPDDKDIKIGNWLELGEGIVSDDVFEQTNSGYSVASSAEGTIVAIGSPNYSTKLPNGMNGLDSGRVQIYEYDESDDEWRMIGIDLLGEPGDMAGSSVALSIAGDYVFVGAPQCTRDVQGVKKKEVGCVKVYEREYSSSNGGDQYKLVGNELVGENSFDHFGSAVDGHAIFTQNDSENYEVLQVAIGSPDAHNEQDERRGRVDFAEYVFDNGSQGTWDKKKVAVGEVASKFGTSLGLSIDDSLLVIGAPNTDVGAMLDAGKVYLYKRQDNGWVHVYPTEGDMNGLSEDQECGTSVSITLRGSYIAYGCPNAGATGEGSRKYKTGYATVKKIVRTDTLGTWSVEKIGKHLWGENEGDRSGYSVDIGDDGTTKDKTGENLYLAVGAPFYDGAPSSVSGRPKYNTGHLRVYHFQGNEWETTALNIDGYESNDLLGKSVAIAFDGHRVIAGAPGTIGYSKIFDLKYTQAPSVAPTMNPTPMPTISKPSKPSKPSRPTSLGGNNNEEYETERGSSLFLILFLFAVVPALLYVVFKTVVYWRARRTYASEFGADVQTSSVSNELEMSSNTGSMNQGGGAQVQRDVI